MVPGLKQHEALDLVNGDLLGRSGFDSGEATAKLVVADRVKSSRVQSSRVQS